MKEIVVVDDNKMFLETLKDFVEGMNKDFKCVAFSNPEDALYLKYKKFCKQWFQKEKLRIEHEAIIKIMVKF